MAEACVSAIAWARLNAYTGRKMRRAGLNADPALNHGRRDDLQQGRRHRQQDSMGEGAGVSRKIIVAGGYIGVHVKTLVYHRGAG